MPSQILCNVASCPSRPTNAPLPALTTGPGSGTGDGGGALLCDADLSVLGGEPDQYARYVAAVRKDYAHIGDADFAAGRAPILYLQPDHDPLAHVDDASAYKERFGERVSVVVIARSSHAVIAEQPDTVSAALISYARELWPDESAPRASS